MTEACRTLPRLPRRRTRGQRIALNMLHVTGHVAFAVALIAGSITAAWSVPFGSVGRWQPLGQAGVAVAVVFGVGLAVQHTARCVTRRYRRWGRA